eukprot:4032947-Prymnesium_polylepis.1
MPGRVGAGAVPSPRGVASSRASSSQSGGVGSTAQPRTGSAEVKCERRLEVVHEQLPRRRLFVPLVYVRRARRDDPVAHHRAPPPVG